MRFNSDVVGDVAGCIAPPYDVIDSRGRDRLYDRNPYNIVRLTKAKPTAKDGPEDNVYTRAGATFKAWLRENVLIDDADEAIYPYIQDFEVAGGCFRRCGFVAIGRLEPFGDVVRPHEETLAAPKADRLNLTRATAAQFGQIFVLYDDDENTAEQIIDKYLDESPLVDFVDDDGVRHRLCAVTRPEDIESICEMMAQKDILIADGHHRYETALNYYNETGKAAARFGMMTFVNMRSNGVVVLPTHRLVAGLEKFDIDELIGRVKEDFSVSEYAFAGSQEKPAAKQKMLEHMKAGFENGQNNIGIYASSGGFYICELTNVAAMSAISRHSVAWQKLDVAVLHKLILEKILGIGSEQLAAQSNVEYIKDTGGAIDEAIDKVDSGEKQAVFFLNPTKLDQVSAVASAGEKMPQKSTFFYPKVFTGLTVYKL